MRLSWRCGVDVRSALRAVGVRVGDEGVENVRSRELRALTANATWLTHWGLVREHPISKWKAAHVPGKVRPCVRGMSAERITASAKLAVLQMST